MFGWPWWRYVICLSSAVLTAVGSPVRSLLPTASWCSCVIYCAFSHHTHVLVRPIRGLYLELPLPPGRSTYSWRVPGRDSQNWETPWNSRGKSDLRVNISPLISIWFIFLIWTEDTSYHQSSLFIDYVDCVLLKASLCCGLTRSLSRECASLK